MATAAGKQRVSTRTVVVSKAFRVVDSETRREFKDKRLQALEADNFVENEVIDAGDEDYDGEEGDKPQQKKKRAKTASALQASLSRWATRKPKPLDRIIFESIADADPDDPRPNYASAAAAPSTAPVINFCSVCGYFGQYTCTRCGMRFCSVRCNAHHKETRCMKFSF